MPRYEATGSTEGLLGPDEDDDDELVRTRVVDMPRIEPATNPKQTVLGLGTPAPPLPSFGTAPPEMLDYGDEDEEAVTTVLAPPSEAEDPPTISTVHEPAKRAFPQQMPDDKIVVAPTLLMPPDEQRTALGGNFASMPGGAPGAVQGMATQPPMGHASAAPGQGMAKDPRSVLIALIAAATTLIALALTALVILKLVEKPEPVAPVTPAVPATTATAAVTPTPPPTPKVLTDPTPPPQPTVAEKPREDSVNAEDLPKEAPKTTAVAPGPAPKPAPKPAPAPAGAGDKSAGGGGPGFLTVMCDPACDAVSAGGRNLGPSPVVRASLPPGNHGVTLRRSGSPTKSISVQIVSGQTTARRVKM